MAKANKKPSIILKWQCYTCGYIHKTKLEPRDFTAKGVLYEGQCEACYKAVEIRVAVNNSLTPIK